MRPFSEPHHVALVPLIAPTSKDRIQKIAAVAQGYVYVVSSLGVTGVRSNITTDIDGIVAEVRKATDIPVAVGFGIAAPEQAYKMAKASDGAIVGSAIEKIVAQDFHFGNTGSIPVGDAKKLKPIRNGRLFFCRAFESGQ